MTFSGAPVGMDSDVSKLAAAINKLAEVHDRRLGEIGAALSSLATHTKCLGCGNESTGVGAVEFLGSSVATGLSELSQAIVAASIRMAEASGKDDGE